MELLEVDYDDLYYLPEGLFLWEDKPFTGLGISNDKEGRRNGEVPFVSGKEHGVAKSWYSTGELESTTRYQNGEMHGVDIEFFKDGKVRKRRVFEFSVLMKLERFDTDGNVLEVFERTGPDRLYDQVLMRRAGR